MRGTGSANTLIVLEGGARDRGERHGRLLADEIHARLESLAESRRAPGVQKRLELLQRNARAALPELVAEVEGIAAGARVPVDDIFGLNAFEALTTPIGCTAVTVPRARGGAVVAQNWDAPPDEAPFLRILLHMEPDGRLRDLLTDHDGAPMSVCRHPGGAEASVTLATLILAPGEGFGSFALGGGLWWRVRRHPRAGIWRVTWLNIR